MQRANEWAFRLDYELKRATTVAFVTLTYDEESCPYTTADYYSRKSKPPVFPWVRKYGPFKRKTLVKKDLQDYFKRVRFHSGIKKLKYYACGEYGTHFTKRPHYHFMIYGLPKSQWYLLESCWNGSRVQIEEPRNAEKANFYCLKYFHKRYNDKYLSGVQKEFALMSKGLGLNYITDSVLFYHKSAIEHCFVVKLSGHKLPMPRYYKNKIYTSYERWQIEKYLELRSRDLQNQINNRLHQANPLLSEEDIILLRTERIRAKKLPKILEPY